jgi:hypothetical protein
MLYTSWLSKLKTVLDVKTLEIEIERENPACKLIDKNI